MTAEGLHRLFHPERVAVIGASARPGSVGDMVLCNLLESDYDGNVFPVNPKHDRIRGAAAYSSITEIPETAKLAVVCTSAKTVPKNRNVTVSPPPIKLDLELSRSTPEPRSIVTSPSRAAGMSHSRAVAALRLAPSYRSMVCSCSNSVISAAAAAVAPPALRAVATAATCEGDPHP